MATVTRRDISTTSAAALRRLRPMTLPASFNAMSTIAAGINDAGAIAGAFTDTSGNGHGFYISGGTYTQLDNPNGTDTAAFGLNNVGQIVGSYVDANGVTQGFIYYICLANVAGDQRPQGVGHGCFWRHGHSGKWH
jgi:uncharacterized membrane protein